MLNGEFRTSSLPGVYDKGVMPKHLVNRDHVRVLSCLPLLEFFESAIKPRLFITEYQNALHLEPLIMGEAFQIIYGEVVPGLPSLRLFLLEQMATDYVKQIMDDFHNLVLSLFMSVDGIQTAETYQITIEKGYLLLFTF